ncbi:NDP-hexose 2,3-dehydratase family protein [Streptomyces sp. NPDC014870]|uniref:NDP-hexose 2,3-dehydratase family protein n=1 Tax=Streptomyces sp. NPDC014870 TaxID=3364925 RepID=UPI0036FB09C1
MTSQLHSLTLLGPRRDDGLADRIARSAAAPVSPADLDRITRWLEGRRDAHDFRVERIPLDALEGWGFTEPSGNLVHDSGRFFSVEGLHVTVSDGRRVVQEWHQPIIRQPEVGILGILAKEFDGVLHFLMQAKMEPGNRNLLQLSPTVQATRSNYTKVHRGADVRYLEYFTPSGRSRVVADVLQSEHGSWFYRKSNRNVIVEALGEVAEHEDFLWLTLAELHALLRLDNIVNMDARTVLACMPVSSPGPVALHSDAEVLSWFSGERSRWDVSARLAPLDATPSWRRSVWSIEHERQAFFRVVGVSVEAGSREVSRWTQPLFEPVGLGVTAFLARRIEGVLHVLVHARVEGGFLDTVELGPTVQCVPGNHGPEAEDRWPPYLDAVLGAPRSRILYEGVHSEEGGRFLNAESRYLVVLAENDESPSDPPAGYRWVTPDQLSALVGHGHYLNVQARTLLVCLRAAGQDTA